MGRLVAIDYGAKRTGIAVTDELQLIASGLTTVETKTLLQFLQDYAKTETVDCFVIGLPKQMNNSLSEIESDIQKFILKLNQVLPNISIKRFDERFTSKIAVRTMINGGVKKKQRQNKSLVDKISATLILQGYLALNS